jgi:hypothetical protein
MLTGQKHSNNKNDITIVCHNCHHKYYFPISNYEGKMMFESLKKNKNIDLYCPFCSNTFTIIDLTSDKKIYGDIKSKPEPNDVFDALYFENDYNLCEEVINKIKISFPEAEIEDCSDGIHGTRKSVKLDKQFRETYLIWLITNRYFYLSFLFNLQIHDKDSNDYEIISKTIKQLESQIKNEQNK